jgi:hypothetical protein
MTRPPRDEAWWDDYHSCRDEGWSPLAAAQYANDREPDPPEAQWEADVAEDRLTVTRGDPMPRKDAA